jgi:predicted transposase YbfD/YdcC
LPLAAETTSLHVWVNGFQSASWVRETWPDRLELVAIDGKTSRRSHDRNTEKAPLHLVSAFATTSRLVLGQEAVAENNNEITTISLLIERLARNDGLNGALISIDAIATNPTIATVIRDAGADYLLAVKANQPTLRSEIEHFFADAPAESLEAVVDVDKGHGRIEQRTVTVDTRRELARWRSPLPPARSACPRSQRSFAWPRGPN